MEPCRVPTNSSERGACRSTGSCALEVGEVGGVEAVFDGWSGVADRLGTHVRISSETTITREARASTVLRALHRAARSSVEGRNIGLRENGCLSAIQGRACARRRSAGDHVRERGHDAMSTLGWGARARRARARGHRGRPGRGRRAGGDPGNHEAQVEHGNGRGCPRREAPGQARDGYRGWQVRGELRIGDGTFGQEGGRDHVDGDARLAREILHEAGDPAPSPEGGKYRTSITRAARRRTSGERRAILHVRAAAASPSSDGSLGALIVLPAGAWPLLRRRGSVAGSRTDANTAAGRHRHRTSPPGWRRPITGASSVRVPIALPSSTRTSRATRSSRVTESGDAEGWRRRRMGTVGTFEVVQAAPGIA